MSVASQIRETPILTVRFVYWQEGDDYLGHFLDYPDYWTQGESLDDLKEHLVDQYHDLTIGTIPAVRKIDELVVSGSASTWFAKLSAAGAC